jgi:hypothetical protein
LSRVDLGVGDTALARKDGGLMPMARVKGPLGSDGIASVLRSQWCNRSAALVVGEHDRFEELSMV